MRDLEYLKRLVEKGDNRFNPLAWVKTNQIGDDTWIGAFCLIDVHVVIGNGCNISCGAHIVSHSTLNRCLMGGDGYEVSPTRIGNKVFVGENATILMGCEIGDQCVIGAGSLVLERTKIHSQTVVVGNPAWPIRRLSPRALADGKMTSCGCVFADGPSCEISRRCNEEHP